MIPLAQKIVSEILEAPRQFSEIVDNHRDIPWPEFLHAWGEIRGLASLTRDDDGHYLFSAPPILE
jgi:hypothetical protein